MEHAGDVAVLGGGTQLLPLMNRDEVSVAHVVDLRGLGLRRITVDADAVTVGALVTYADVLRSADLAGAAPHLQRVSHGVTGGRQLRNSGTLVGSACFAMPGTDVPGALVGLGARFSVHGPAGDREVPAGDFFRDAFSTALRPGEIVLSFTVDRQAVQTGYCKIKHSSGSWPIVTATAVRTATGATVTLGGAQAVPLQVDVGDLVPAGLVPADRPARLAEVADRVARAVTDPWTDVLAPGSYRAQIAGPAAKRALLELAGSTS